MLDKAIKFEEYIHFNPKLFVISGVSGVGKDAAIRLMEKRKLPFHFVVTATSRPPRPNEVNGVDYIFVSQEEFEEMIANNQLIEHAIVYEQYKGVPRAQVEDAINQGKDVVMRLDVQGAAKVKNMFPEAILIFLIPPNEEEWYQRLRARQTESPENLKVRIEAARKELEALSWFHYLVINYQGRLDDTVDTIESIIRAEHCRLH